MRINPYKMLRFAPVPNVVCELTDITSTSKLLYGRLSQHYGKDGVCHPSRETLAEEIGVSVSWIDRSLKQLVSKKLIEIEKPQGWRRLSHYNNQYHFLDDALDLSIPPHSHSSATPTSHSSATPTNRSILKRKDCMATQASTPSATASASPPKDKIPRWCHRFANQIAEWVKKKHKINHTSSVSAWAREIHKLHTIGKVPRRDIKRALRWYESKYFAHEGQTGFPIIECGKKLRDGGYQKILRAMKNPEWNDGQEQGESKGMGESKIRVIYTDQEADLEA